MAIDATGHLIKKVKFHTRRSSELMDEYSDLPWWRIIKREKTLDHADGHRRCANFYHGEVVKLMRASRNDIDNECDSVMADLERLLNSHP